MSSHAGVATGATAADFPRLSRVRRTPQGCLEWLGSKQPRGYGWINIRGKIRLVHRVAYELHTGTPIPPKLVVAHRCDNPACIELSHLVLMTQRENLLDKVRRGRDQNATKTHCKRGHILTGTNVRVYGTSRACVVCRKAYDAARYAARKVR